MTTTPEGEPQDGRRETPSGGAYDAPPPYGADRLRPSREALSDLSRLRRVRQDKYIAGVAGGLARHFDVDPIIIRVALAVLVFFGGAGLLIYGACWLFVPKDGEQEGQIALEPRTRSLALYIAAGLAVLLVLGDTVGGVDFPWPLAIIGLIVLVIITGRDRKAQQRWQNYPAAPTSPPPAPSGSTAPPAPGQPTSPGFGPAQGPQGPSSSARTGDVPQPPLSAGMPGMAPSSPPAPPYGAVPPTSPLPPPPPAAAPRNPRKRGPLLFWFTLALIVLAQGVLGMVDVAGAAVPDSAYPALAVGLTGLMLVLGAFWGRAGGLILIGLVSVLALGIGLAVQEFDGRTKHLEITPTTAAAVSDDYDFDAGELELDLRQVRDVEQLDGRTIGIDGGAGRIEVIVPEGVTVEASGDVAGPGAVSLFGDEAGGIATTREQTYTAGGDAPTLTLDAELGVGEIAVLHPSDLSSADLGSDYDDWSN